MLDFALGVSEFSFSFSSFSFCETGSHVESVSLLCLILSHLWCTLGEGIVLDTDAQSGIPTLDPPCQVNRVPIQRVSNTTSIQSAKLTYDWCAIRIREG